MRRSSIATAHQCFKRTRTRAQAHAVTLSRIVRAPQWWDYKLVPIYSIFYATAYTEHVSVAAIWPAAVALLLALAPCAAYVSLVNDLSDRVDDRRAGKDNRMAGRPGWQAALILAAPLLVAVAFMILWRDDLPLVVAYLCAWGAFTLYSVPPFRFKRRGILGVIADASGAHLFPTLVAALLAYRAGGKPVDWFWLGAVAAWAFGCGLRGILWHQLYDLEADRKAAVETFVQRHSRRAAVRLAVYGALPIELVALAALLWRMHSPWPLLLLLVYAAFAIVKSRVWDLAIVIVQPRERYAILGMEYYTLLFAVGILLSCVLRYPADWAVVIAHLLVFPRPAVVFVKEMRLLGRDLIQSKR